MVIKFCILVVDIVVFVCASINRVGQERLAMVIKLFNFFKVVNDKILIYNLLLLLLFCGF